MIRLDSSRQKILWQVPGKPSKKLREIHFRDILSIEGGCTTKVFARYPHLSTRNAPCCLSIVAKKRTLDIELESPQEQQVILNALKMWWNKNNEN